MADVGKRRPLSDILGRVAGSTPAEASPSKTIMFEKCPLIDNKRCPQAGYSKYFPRRIQTTHESKLCCGSNMGSFEENIISNMKVCPLKSLKKKKRKRYVSKIIQ